jgi:hypothetical protein
VSEITTCPRCHGSLKGAHVTERGLVCPHCANPLGGAGMDLLPAPSYPDVRRRTGAFVSFAVAIAVGLVLIALVLIQGVGRASLDVSDLVILGFVFAYLDVVVILALALSLLRWRGLNEWTKNVWVASLFVFLLLGIIAGVLIVMFATCHGLLYLRNGLGLLLSSSA